jgi:hypothetical protein
MRLKRPFRERRAPAMFKPKKNGMTVVHRDTLFFVSHAADTLKVDHAVPLDTFLKDEYDLSSVPAAVRSRNNQLLLVPDFWMGQTDLTLKSRKRSLVEPFVERKLASEHPDLPEIGLFFNYLLATKVSESGNLYAFYLLEPLSYRLYKKLAALGMEPVSITTPAYVWECKLEKRHPELVQSGWGLIQKLSNSAYLYFYHKGQFLFSRRIPLLAATGDDPGALNALIYECNQSFYLFSQKKKAELEHILMHSPRQADAAELTESLGREVRFLDTPGSSDGSIQDTIRRLGPCGSFLPGDLAQPAQYLTLVQKDHARARAWRPVQVAGIMIGILLCLLLGGERFFLFKWSQMVDLGPTHVGAQTVHAPSEIIDQYNQDLDIVLEEAQRPLPSKTLLALATCLPENVSIRQMKMVVAGNPHIALTCVIRAQDTTEFRQSLSTLLANLGNAFTGSPRLGKRDVELGETMAGPGYVDYPVRFELRL